MQLTKKGQLASQLGVAVLSTLASVSASQAANIPGQTLVEFSVLNYSESDPKQSRVNIVEPVVRISHQVSQDENYSVQLAYDTLSGASPNGAKPSPESQTFTGASGESSYTTPPNVMPLDPNFEDERFALTLSTLQPMGENKRVNLVGHYSKETDWASLGGNATFMKDINQKATTISMGLGFTLDGINPRVLPKPMSRTSEITTTTAPSGEDSETGENRFTYEGVLGVTHTLNRKTLLSFNYSLSSSSGYHSDPYKLVSLVNADGTPADYIWDSRPDSRLRQTLSSGLVTAIGEDALHLKYRYYWDDWGVKSHTLDSRYVWQFTDAWKLEPHVRLSQQSAADFYYTALLDSEPLPSHATSDYRLGVLNTYTLGVKWIWQFDQAHLSLNVEQYVQQGETHPDDAIGVQRQQNMFPTITAQMVTLGWSMVW